MPEMSGPPPPANRRHRFPDGGQFLLLVVSVGAAVVFCFLYISGRQTQDQATGASPTGIAANVPMTMVPSQATSPATATHEPTHVLVEQVLVVQPGPNQAAEKILVRTPAVFPTGTVQWNPDQVTRARNLQARLAAVLRHQDAIGREIERLESEWSQLVQDGLPMDALLPDSPSVPAPSGETPP